MILETTNPKYLSATQIFVPHKVYERPGRSEPEWASEYSRTICQPQAFRDRAPNATPSREPEPDPAVRPKATSLRLRDEAHDAPLWLIVDRVTGHIMARVRGSLPYIVFQTKLVAAHHGGDFSDLYYRRADA